jgi:pyruvate,water dikinase
MTLVRWLHQELARETAGGKAAALSDLLSAGFPVPPGFAITADAYRYFEESTGAAEELRRAESIDIRDAREVSAFAQPLASLIEAAELPSDLAGEISEAYAELVSLHGPACAVRSSAISEDSDAASFAGLYESYLNVRGTGDVIDAVKRCYASLWSEGALRYRALKRGSFSGDAMAVVVMGLAVSRSSGVAFTAHPVTGERDRVLINASWGLGQAIVSGRVTPDSFVVEKGSLALLEREIHEKTIAIYPDSERSGVIESALAPAKSQAPSISDEEARQVAQIAIEVEEYFGRPQDLEWALADGRIHLLQSRPITTL